MLKKFCLSIAVAGALISGIGMINTTFINTALAEEKEKVCDKCNHVPSKIVPDCPCPCHGGERK
ncbi:MAG: hypothetical protein JETT_2817 [Candidatus Jettenia ecosi]|uniref:Uncharacterized protein n=1 Tax=Candidatus Jettenia ecosi TaxID=2494326 RepID=A0A533QK50_9BACT|nr:MAG: hypothetical protein JETT_2817 [Candidatus Jettenia ecosi]